MKRSIQSFVILSIYLSFELLNPATLNASQAQAKKTIRLEAWKNPNPEQSPVEILEKKTKEKNDLKRENLKRLHNAAISYATNYHNNSAEFEYSFCQDADPVVNLFKTAAESDLKIDSLYCSLRILVNASKSCEYIRDCSLNAVLEGIDKYADKYFATEDESTNNKDVYRKLETTIYDFMQQSSDITLSSPGAFSSKLATQVFKVSAKGLKPTQTKEWQDRLSTLMFRFLETNINKTLWDVSDPQSIWESILTSANSLYQLSKILVHMDDLDDLLWSLTRRFIWFLDYSAGQLPLAFYENIEESINDGSTFFLELGEQDSKIQSKKEILITAVKKAKTKALESNIFNDGLMPLEGKIASNATPATEINLIEPLNNLFDLTKNKSNFITAKTNLKTTKKQTALQV